MERKKEGCGKEGRMDKACLSIYGCCGKGRWKAGLGVDAAVLSLWNNDILIHFIKVETCDEVSGEATTAVLTA